jgi:hypothetical protein
MMSSAPDRVHSGTEEIPPPSDRARIFIHSQSRHPLQPIRMTQQSFDMRGVWLAGVHCKKRSAIRPGTMEAGSSRSSSVSSPNMCANTSASKTLPGAETKAPKYSWR